MFCTEKNTKQKSGEAHLGFIKEKIQDQKVDIKS